MTEEIAGPERIEARERYNTWSWVSVGLGVLSYGITTAAWMVLDQPLVLFAGLGLYWVGCAGMAVVAWTSPVSLRDEFEKQVEQEVTYLTFLFVTVAVILGIPAYVTFSATGVYAMPPAFQGALGGYALLVFVYMTVAYLVGRRYD